MVVNLLLALEDAVELIAYLSTYGMTYDALHAVTAERAAGGNRLRQFQHLVAVGTDVSGDVVVNLAQRAAVADVELDTLVQHLAGIDPLLSTFTHHSDAWHVDQNVLRLLVVPLERTVQRVVEQSEVQTEVSLCRRFPLQVVVAQLVALET